MKPIRIPGRHAFVLHVSYREWLERRKCYAIKENTDTLVVASKKSGLEANADKTKYIGMPRDQKAGRRHI